MVPMEDGIKAREKYNLALTKAKEGIYQESLHLLEETLKLDPSLLESYNLMGKVYLQMGEISKAKYSWKKTLHLDPSNITAKTCLDALTRNKFPGWLVSISIIAIIFILLQITSFIILNRKANLHMNLIKKEVKDGTISILNNLDKGLNSLDSSIMAIKKDLVVQKEKIDAFEKVAAVGKESIEDRYRKGVYLFLEGKYKESRRLLMMLPMHEVKENLKDNIFFWIGLCFYREGRYTEALNQFQKVLELYPNGNKVPEARKWKTLSLKKMHILEKPKK